MNTEAQRIICHVLTSGEPVGRWRAARVAGASPRNARNVFTRMLCLVPAGKRLRNGNSEPEQLFRVDRNLIPACCRECSYDTGACDPKWRDTTASLGIEMTPQEDEAV